MTSHVLKPDMTIIIALSALCGAHDKMYCFPSQQTIIEILASKYNTKLSRRALNNHLGALESQGWIARICRHRVTRNGTEWRSTLYTLTRKTQRFIARTTQNMRVLVSKLDLKSLFQARVKKPAHNILKKSKVIAETHGKACGSSAIDPTAFFELKKKEASNAVKPPKYHVACKEDAYPISTMPEGFIDSMRSLIKRR